MSSLIKAKNISKNLLENGFDVRMPTIGMSMFPLMRTGDRITITPQRNFVIGDLVVFAKKDNVICHRLVSIFEKGGIKYYQTRGDSFFGLDEPVTADQILGKVIRIERDSVSISRRLLLFIYPVLGFGQLSVCVTRALMKIRSLFFSVL